MGLTPMPDHDDAPLPKNIADDETAIASALTSPPASPTAIGGARGRIVAAAAILVIIAIGLWVTGQFTGLCSSLNGHGATGHTSCVPAT